MSRSDLRAPHSNAGFTLLETMVALAIVATITAVAASGLRGPSPSLQLDREVSNLLRQASLARDRAVTEQVSVPFVVPNCEGGEGTVMFYRDGTASGDRICVAVAGVSRALVVSVLTGRLIPQAIE